MKFLITALRDVSVLADGRGFRLVRGQQVEINSLQKVFCHGAAAFRIPQMPQKQGEQCEVADALLVIRIQ